MEIVITILTFLALIINIPYVIALYNKLKLEVLDYQCKEEIEGVNNNKKAIKVISTINVALFLIILILISV